MFEIGVNFDALRIYDGNSSESTLLAEVTGGPHSNIILSSTGSQMFITFNSDESGSSRGFHATFHEETIPSNDLVTKTCTQKNPCLEGEGQCYTNNQCYGTLKCGMNNCEAELGYSSHHDCCYDYCGQWLDMKSGTITSPEYPNPYNNHEECIWNIFAKENQTILLKFVDFGVSQSHANVNPFLHF